MKDKEDEPNAAHKVGPEHQQLNQKGEMPRSPEGDAGMKDEKDLEKAKRKP